MILLRFNHTKIPPIQLRSTDIWPEMAKANESAAGVVSNVAARATTATSRVQLLAEMEA